jgi:hypothetical protein
VSPQSLSYPCHFSYHLPELLQLEQLHLFCQQLLEELYLAFSWLVVQRLLPFLVLFPQAPQQLPFWHLLHR